MNKLFLLVFFIAFYGCKKSTVPPSTQISSKKTAFVLVGDSNTEGYSSTDVGAGNYFNILSSSIQKINTPNSPIGFTNFRDPPRYGITISGATTVVPAGPTNTALKMTAGSTIEFTSSAAFVEFWYNGDTSGGNIQMSYNGSVYRTVNCRSVTRNNISSFSNLATPGTKSGKYTLTCTGGDVTITALFTSLQINTGHPAIYFLRDGVAGETTASFDVTHIAATTGLIKNANTFYLLALGTNDIYSPTNAITTAQYRINLTNYLKALSANNLTVAYFMPPQPMPQNDYPIYEPYANYHAIAEDICKQLNVDFYDPGVDLDMKNNASYWFDFHYSAAGHAALANYFLQQLDLDQFEPQ